MIVGAVKESYPGENRVALVPASLSPLLKAGLEVLLEAGAGLAAGFTDRQYEQKGARIAASRADVFASADLLLQVRTLGANLEAGITDLGLIRPGQALVGFAEPLSAPDAAAQIAARGGVLFAMELMPRITRAQSMDALSSMATIIGYKAVLVAAAALPKMFPMLMTAAGTVSPARVLIVGAGVAGLQAIATARRLGAVVEAYDVRPAVKEQVQSLGGRFLELPLETASAEAAGGYARQQDESFLLRQRELMQKAVAAADVVITTAAVPGQKAPVIVTSEMVAAMAPGSVIIDLAAQRGGNCELTRADETAIHGGVTILGPTNLASSVAHHASQMYSRNVSELVLHLTKGGTIELNLDDEITRETLVSRDGEIVNKAVRSLLADRGGPENP